MILIIINSRSFPALLHGFVHFSETIAGTNASRLNSDNMVIGVFRGLGVACAPIVEPCICVVPVVDVRKVNHPSAGHLH